MASGAKTTSNQLIALRRMMLPILADYCRERGLAMVESNDLGDVFPIMAQGTDQERAFISSFWRLWRDTNRLIALADPEQVAAWPLSVLKGVSVSR